MEHSEQLARQDLVTDYLNEHKAEGSLEIVYLRHVDHLTFLYTIAGLDEGPGAGLFGVYNLDRETLTPIYEFDPEKIPPTTSLDLRIDEILEGGLEPLLAAMAAEREWFGISGSDVVDGLNPKQLGTINDIVKLAKQQLLVAWYSTNPKEELIVLESELLVLTQEIEMVSFKAILPGTGSSKEHYFTLRSNRGQNAVITSYGDKLPEIKIKASLDRSDETSTAPN